MQRLYKTIFYVIFSVSIISLCSWQPAEAQTKPLTYPEIITALNTKLPNSAFSNKTALIDFLINQIKQRKVEKALSTEMEGILRQSGATTELIQIIKNNSQTASSSSQSSSANERYADLSESGKRQFIETKVGEFLGRFGRTEADKISSPGIDLIKSAVDSYLRRLSINDNTFGNSDGMVSKNSCNFGRGNLVNVFKRGSGYSSVIKESFENVGVQPEIGMYIAFIETEYCPCLQSPTGPLGMFQLTKSMAEVNGLDAVAGASPEKPDGRCNPKEASKAAATYIKKLFNQFYGKDVNGILFSVAAYNSGEGMLNRNIRLTKESGKTNVSFWDLIEEKAKLSQQFQMENYRYVPKFLAAAVIGENPASFGINEFQPLMPFNKVLEKENVTDKERDFWTKQRNKALEPRDAPVGVDLDGLQIPDELIGVNQQWTNLDTLKAQGYPQPMDYFDLAEKSLSGEYVEVPLVTENYLLEIGGSATDVPFTKFSFKGGAKTSPANSPEFKKLKQFADELNGQKLDLNNPQDRKQVRIRLLRLLQPKALVVLEEIAQKYTEKFGHPLRVTSLVRPIDYQIELNKYNASSFLVRENGRIPPHSSGQAFDIAFKNMTAEEQNFLLKLLAGMEGDGKIDAMRESGVNATLHVFVF